MTRHTFFGLTAIIEEIDQLNKPLILDLGVMTTGTFTFFSDRKCKIYFENLSEILLTHPDVSITELNEKIDNYLLNYGESTKFDVILAWDLLNYLELDTIEKLMSRLNPHCRTDTLFHMVKYRNPRIPLTPCQFKVIDQHNFSVDESELDVRRVPVHSTYKLLKHMANFFIQSDLKPLGVEAHFSEHLMRYNPSTDKRNVYTPAAQPAKGKDKPVQGALLHESPGIALLCQQLKGLRSPKILEIGSKLGPNINYFSEFCEKVYVEDLYSSIHWWQNIDKTREQKLSKQALSYLPETQFDAIIVWDLFNFCSVEQIKLISEQLSLYCHTETLLFAVLYSSGKTPQKPQRFFMHNDHQVQIAPSSVKAVPPSRLTTASLFKHLPDFSPGHSFLMREGMQPGISEFLFTSRQTKSKKQS